MRLPNGQDRLPFLSVMRASCMLLSCVSILAVDFPAFPRRFAKTETFGKSLMDVGVGAIVISMGLVHGKLLGKPFSFGSMIGKAVRGSVPLLLIGSLRFWTVKASDYQVRRFFSLSFTQ